jgi:hypothetical protein
MTTNCPQGALRRTPRRRSRSKARPRQPSSPRRISSRTGAHKPRPRRPFRQKHSSRMRTSPRWLLGPIARCDGAARATAAACQRRWPLRSWESSRSALNLALDTVCLCVCPNVCSVCASDKAESCLEVGCLSSPTRALQSLASPETPHALHRFPRALALKKCDRRDWARCSTTPTSLASTRAGQSKGPGAWDGAGRQAERAPQSNPYKRRDRSRCAGTSELSWTAPTQAKRAQQQDGAQTEARRRTMRSAGGSVRGHV